MRQKWTSEQHDFLINNYEKLTVKEIAEKIQRSERSVSFRAFYFGMRKLEKRIVNENYFAEWNKDMAYVLGYIMADGCVRITSKGYVLKLVAHEKDCYMLKWITGQISPNAVLRKRRTQNLYAVDINSRKLVESLGLYNITPRKTSCEILPNIPEEYKSHYLCGLFDGDGSFGFYSANSKHTKKKMTLCIASGDIKFMEQVKSELCFNLGSVRKRTRGAIWYCSKFNDVCTLIDYMYQDRDFCLYRKHPIIMGNKSSNAIVISRQIPIQYL